MKKTFTNTLLWLIVGIGCIFLSVFVYFLIGFGGNEGKIEVTLTGNVVDSGSVDIKTLTGIDIQPIDTGDIIGYQDYLDLRDIGNYLSFFPKNQPLLADKSLSYEERSNSLVQYLKNNTFIARIPSKISRGYLYIKLGKKTSSDLFFYRNNSKISGRILLKKPLKKISDTEYLFDMKHIPVLLYPEYSKVLDYNMFSYLRFYNSPNYIGGFVSSFDGNKIQEITIVYEFIN